MLSVWTDGIPARDHIGRAICQPRTHNCESACNPRSLHDDEGRMQAPDLAQ